MRQNNRSQQQQLPMLLFILENGKHRQVIKTMLNRNLSEKLLTEYGLEMQPLSKIDQFKIKEQIEHFSVDELIEIKGASSSKVKRYQNCILQQTLLRKLRSSLQKFDQQTRKTLWLQFTQIYAYDNLYEGLEDLQLPPDTEALLQKDIKRTFYHFDQELSPQQQLAKTQDLRQDIRQVLSRFALYNPYVLYCQGMNEIVAFFHEEGISPKQSFFLLKRLTEVILPSDYYSSLQGITAYLKVLWEMVTVLFPKVHQKLMSLIRELDISGSYLCVFSHFIQWFVCLFTNSSLNRNIRRVLFDYLLLEGITVLFKASIAFMGFLEPFILATSSFDQYVACIQQRVTEYADVRDFTQIMNNKFISKEILELYTYYSTPSESTVNFNKKRFGFEKKCNRKWNFCQQKLDDNIYEQHRYEFFVFKRRESVKIIPDYLDKINSFYFNKKKPSRPTDQLQIGRISHVCNSTSQTCTEDSLSETNTKNQDSPGSIRHSPTPKKASFSNINVSVKQPTKNSQKKQSQPFNKIKEFCSFGQEKQEVEYLDQGFHRKETIEYREQIKKRIDQETGKGTLQKSESMMFMKMMVENQSYSNLFNLLQNEDMDRMFDLGEDSEDLDDQS